jgi:hypothetical protein
MASAFNGARQLALVFSAGACLSSRADFPILSHKTAQDFHLFVINRSVLIGAKLAFARMREKPSVSALIIIRLITHDLSPRDLNCY